MKHINRYITTLVALFIVVGLSIGQTPQNRSSSTIIADVLAQLPAQTQPEYNKMMADLTSTGTDGLLYLIGQLNDPGNKTNEALDYAISGWTNYVANDDAKRKEALEAYEKALTQSIHNENKAMIIRQIEKIGDNSNVPALSVFVNDSRLAGPATQALAQIGSEDAKQLLLSELTKADTEDLKLVLANAVAQAKYPEAEAVFINLLSENPSEDLRKVAYNGLANIGTKNALSLLKKDAQNDNWAYGKANATSAYISVLKNITKTDAKLAEKEAMSLLKVADKSNKADLKIAAAEIAMASGSSKNADKLLRSAMKSGDVNLMNNLFSLYDFKKNPKATATILKSLKPKSSPAVQAAILYWIGKQNMGSATSLVSGFLKSPNSEVQKAAVTSLINIGTEEAMLPLAGMLKSGNAESVALAQNALNSYSGDMSYTLASVFEESDNDGKIAALQLMSNRKMDSQYNLVYNQMFSDNEVVKAEAANTLKDVASADNIDDLFNLLEQSDSQYVPAIQTAINSVLSSMTQAEQMKVVAEKMISTDKKHLYYPALANSQSAEAMEALIGAYNSETGANKKAAFDALKQWKTFDGVYPILDIARASNDSNTVSEAVDAIIQKVASSNQTGAVKYLYLREAMGLAKTDVQKNNILRLIGNTGLYQAMLYVAPFMDNAALSESAAQAAMNIGTNNPQFAGEETTNILKKVSKTLNNPDAGYQRQNIDKFLAENPQEGGFVSIFNGKNLDGWKGLVANPIARAKMTAKQLAAAQEKANKQMNLDWKVEDGLIIFDGKGFDNLCTEKQYGDFEMLVDWKMYPGPEPDAGIYLRGTPQVQIWDTARVDVGAQVGSGGLYNNIKNESKPLKVADQKVGEWNTFRIKMIGDRVWVWLNDELVTDNVMLENFWDRKQPIFPIEQIELQAHGSKVAYRDIFIKEIERTEPFELSAEEKKEGYRVLFDGTNMHEWTGNTEEYILEDGNIVMRPTKSFGGNLYTKDEFDNFVFRFEFMLTPGANNGLGIRTPMEGDAAYVGMELQILDDDAPIYKDLEEYQYHGSVYGVIPAKRGHLKPMGEWNYQEVVANGDNIKITLNGEVIVDGNLRDASKNGTIDGKDHPGLLNKSGHIGFLGHGSVVKFKNIRVKELK